MIPLATTTRLKFRVPVAITAIMVGTLAWYVATELLLAADVIDEKTLEALTCFQLNAMNPFQALSSMFSHASLAHWGGNMLFLWVFGAALEDRLGPQKFMGLFLATGLSALGLHTLFYYLAHWSGPYPDRFVLGASGAISGIMGLSARRFPKAKVILGVNAGLTGTLLNLKVPILWFVLFRVLMDLVAVLDGDGVAHWAHLGGFAGGFIAASFLALKKEGEGEILEDQARELFDRAWYPQALERLDRLLVLKPKDGACRQKRALCLYKQWPVRPSETLRRQTLAEAERALGLFIEAKEDEQAWRLYHDFIPPFQPEDFSERTRHVMLLWQGRFSLAGLRPAGAQELGQRVDGLKEAVLAQWRAGDKAGAAEDFLELLRQAEQGSLDLELLRLGYLALRSQGQARWTDIAEDVARRHPELGQVLQALQDLAREWVNTPKQARLGYLIQQVEERHAASAGDPRILDLKERLRRV
jgi:membrane associated rhomboid family serine protease